VKDSKNWATLPRSETRSFFRTERSDTGKALLGP
jgi:hypothetical protein